MWCDWPRKSATIASNLSLIKLMIWKAERGKKWTTITLSKTKNRTKEKKNLSNNDDCPILPERNGRQLCDDPKRAPHRSITTVWNEPKRTNWQMTRCFLSTGGSTKVLQNVQLHQFQFAFHKIERETLPLEIDKEEEGEEVEGEKEGGSRRFSSRLPAVPSKTDHLSALLWTLSPSVNARFHSPFAGYERIANSQPIGRQSYAGSTCIALAPQCSLPPPLLPYLPPSLPLSLSSTTITTETLALAGVESEQRLWSNSSPSKCSVLHFSRLPLRYTCGNMRKQSSSLLMWANEIIANFQLNSHQMHMPNNRKRSAIVASPNKPGLQCTRPS